jgi:hypothetical protein
MLAKKTRLPDTTHKKQSTHMKIVPAIGTYPRLHIPAGILRIPVFSVPVAFFSQESRFLFCRNFFRTSSENLSVWGLCRKLHRISIVRQIQSTIQCYGTLRWFLSTTITAPPPPLLHRHRCAAPTTATPIAAPPSSLPLLRHLSRCCTAIAVAAPPKPSLHHHRRRCTAIAIAAPPPSLPSLRPSLRHHCCSTTTETGDEDNGDDDGDND